MLSLSFNKRHQDQGTTFKTILVFAFKAQEDNLLYVPPHVCFVSQSFLSGENVEEAFLEAAKRIYQNIQDGSLDLNAAESGVQHKPSAPQGGRLNADSQPAKDGCSC